MKWSFHLVKVAGIDVRVHATFFLLLLWTGVMYYQDGGYTAMISGQIFILLLFLCVVLHEFGHALAAKMFGINTPDITLLPIGGVARLERMPDKPSQELIVALAGPAVNVLIAIVLFLIIGKFSDLADLEHGGVLPRLMAINIMLVIFNMLPAFPMDGGRVLRAILAMRLKYARATKVAAIVGQIMAVGFGIFGFLSGNPFLLFIAIFVFMGAQGEANYSSFKEVVEETKVSSLMHHAQHVLPAGLTVVDAVRIAMLAQMPALPVVDDSMRLMGMLPMQMLAHELKERPEARVAGLGFRQTETFQADEALSDILLRIQNSEEVLFPVVNNSGQLVGLLSQTDVQDFFRNKQ